MARPAIKKRLPVPMGKRSDPDALLKQKESILESMKGLASGGKPDIEDPEEVVKKRRRPIINAVVGFKKPQTSA